MTQTNNLDDVVLDEDLREIGRKRVHKIIDKLPVIIDHNKSKYENNAEISEWILPKEYIALKEKYTGYFDGDAQDKLIYSKLPSLALKLTRKQLIRETKNLCDKIIYSTPVGNLVADYRKARFIAGELMLEAAKYLYKKGILFDSTKGCW